VWKAIVSGLTPSDNVSFEGDNRPDNVRVFENQIDRSPHIDDIESTPFESHSEV
jgi:hypothetical protein